MFPIVSEIGLIPIVTIFSPVHLQIGSVTLGGLYLVIKYLGQTWINWLLGIYFSLTGVASIWRVRQVHWTFASQGTDMFIPCSRPFPCAVSSWEMQDGRSASGIPCSYGEVHMVSNGPKTPFTQP
jgi:hypothetical protein